MFSNIGATEIILIAIVGLLLFGPQKLPEIGRMLGRTMNEFKKGAREIMEDIPSSVNSGEPSSRQEGKQAEVKSDSAKADTAAAEAAAPSHNPKRLPE